MFLRQSLSSTADESVAAAQAAVQDQDPSAPRCCLSCPTGHLWEKRLSARVGTYPLPGVSQLGKFSAGLAGAGTCRCTREKHSSAWEQSKVNAFGATRVCPAPPLAQALAVVLQHCRVRLLTRQTPFRGLQRSQGQHTPAQPSPGGYFAKEGSLWRRFLWLGIKVPGSCPDSQYLAVAQPGSAAGFVCQAAAGGGREGEEGSAVPVLGRWGQPSCLSPGNMEMGVKPHGTPGKGRWEAGMLGKGADREQDSQSPAVTGKQLFFVQPWRRCPFAQLGRCSGSMAGPSLS